MELKQVGGDQVSRLAVCAVVAVAVVYGVEKLCEGKHYPLWEKYGPWLGENKVQAIAVVAAVLYGTSLALWPEGKPVEKPEGDYEACP